MNIALILSGLLIGASSWTPSGDSLSTPQLSSPTSGLPLPPIQQSPSSAQPQANRSVKQDAQSRTIQRSQARSSRYGSTARSQQQNAQNAENDQQMMPIPPTASGSQMGQNYQYLPPTATSSDSAGSGGRPAGPYGAMNVPTSPTRGRPDIPQSYSSMQTAAQQNRIQQAAKNSTTTSAPSSTKAFSGYRQTSSGPSPYMNLFRTGNAQGTIDNYTTLVKPELEQRNANQQFGSDISGLESSNRVQGMNIQQLNRDTRSLQGVNANQYFMNYGDYYKGR
jgi:hypothetical protein